MLLAYVIYTSLPLLMVLSLRTISNRLVDKKYIYVNRRILQHLIILLVTIIIGYRYDVGSDYFSYEQMYLSQDSASFVERYGIEYIFYIIYHVCYKLGVSYNFALCVLNIIPICLLYKTFRDQKVFAWIIIMLFLSGQFFLHLNIVRQSIALFVLIYSTSYIHKRLFARFIVCVIIAAGFHTSAVLFLPFYFIPYLSAIITNRTLQYILFIGTLLFSDIILNALVGLMTIVMQYTPYAQYGDLLTTYEVQTGSGVGVIMKAISGLAIINYSTQLSNKYKKCGFDVFYLIYFAGALMSNIFGVTSLLLLRLIFLFDSFRFIVLGYLFHFLYGARGITQHVVFMILISGYIAYFIGMIYLHNSHCSPWQFAL